MNVGRTEICRDSPETRKPPSGGYLTMCLTGFLALPRSQRLVINDARSTVTPYAGQLRKALLRRYFPSNGSDFSACHDAQPRAHREPALEVFWHILGIRTVNLDGL